MSASTVDLRMLGLHQNSNLTRSIDILRRRRPGPIGLARVLLLAAPTLLDLSDEWAYLASELFGRSYTVSDLATALCAARGPFVVSEIDGVLSVGLRNSWAELVATAGIPISASEHFGYCFRALGFSWCSTPGCLTTSLIAQSQGCCLLSQRSHAITSMCNDPTASLLADPATLTMVLDADHAALEQRQRQASSVSSALLPATAPQRDRASYLLLVCSPKSGGRAGTRHREVR